ncbi:hypothetical protein [Eubacterium sp. ER2]|uniref:hypothetical protein n=1 Tax=Eubacterium sp. ER2 TaxID=1519438 RepID=UPI000A5C2FA0|nr:hypothetical protein [Eubacterium sp. ER2]
MLLREEEYSHAVAVLAGREEKDPLFTELEQWFEETYSLRVYNYFCERTNAGRPRLRLLLWDRDCAGKMKKGANPDERKQRRTAEKFAALCVRHNTHPAYRRPGDFLVTYDTLRDEIQKRVLQRCAGEIRSIEAPDIWRMEILFDRVHVFFETDEQRDCHQADGVCGSIRRKMDAIVERHDPFGAFVDGVQCVFTSRQTLDEKYDGNMFYYTR